MEESILIYDGDKLIMEFVVVKERNYTLYAIKKDDVLMGITKRTFLKHIQNAKIAGYTMQHKANKSAYAVKSESDQGS